MDRGFKIAETDPNKALMIALVAALKKASPETFESLEADIQCQCDAFPMQQLAVKLKWRQFFQQFGIEVQAGP